MMWSISLMTIRRPDLRLILVDQFGNRLIEQIVGFGHRRLYLMLFEDGNRIDLTLCPKGVYQRVGGQRSYFTVIKTTKACLKPIRLVPALLDQSAY